MNEENNDNDEDLNDDSAPAEEGDSPARKNIKKHTLRKAPQAPKRFKSSYICFFMAKQPEIKEALGDKATVTEISKRSAEMWKNLPADERAYWDDVAAKDKERYMVEKASYTGPWQVPWKRAKKDPSAPKRPMSAFLFFSQGRRSVLKKKHPEMKNTEVSRLLGELWRNSPEHEKQPYIDKEREERELYKVAIAQWRKEAEERQKQQAQEQNTKVAAAAAAANADVAQHAQPSAWGTAEATQAAPAAGTEPLPAAHPHYEHGYHHHPPPAPYMYQPPPYPYPYPAGPYGFPPQASAASKQPVILGPTGVPRHYSGMPPQPPPGSYPDPQVAAGYAPEEEIPEVAAAAGFAEYTDSAETTE